MFDGLSGMPASCEGNSVTRSSTLIASVLVGLLIAYRIPQASPDPLIRSVVTAVAGWVAGMLVAVWAWIQPAIGVKGSEVKITLGWVPLGASATTVIAGAAALHLTLTSLGGELRDLILGGPPLLFGVAGAVSGLLAGPAPPGSLPEQ